MKPRDEVVRGGMGLAIFVGYLEAHGLRVDARFASDASLGAFRDAVTPLLGDPEVFVAVNYHRPALGQEGSGHISPLGAYHAASDRFLVLDVSRHRYPPVWVEAGDLFMLPPTWLTCLEIGQYAAPADVLAAAGERDLEMFTPAVEPDGDGFVLSAPARFHDYLARD